MIDEAKLRELAGYLWLSSNCYDMTAAAELWRMRKEMNAEALEAEEMTASKPVH
jgi:hypothetical protein